MRTFACLFVKLDMINRELIRQKVVQIIYSYCQRGGGNPEQAEKELLISMSKAYELYNYMLLLLVEMNRMAVRMQQMRQARLTRLGRYETESTKFIDNRFMLQLESNRQLADFFDNHNRFWSEQEEFVRSLYMQVEESDIYKQYMAKPTSTYAEEREIWRVIYRTFICNNDEIDTMLEEKSLYWDDDKAVVDTFVLKTINRFSENTTPDMPLLPEFRDEADREFAIRLLRRALSNADYLLNLIGATTRRWELGRVALMDRIVMQVALAEITSFPSIPISVSINEYVEIAKRYSTPKSGKYVNATLDHIAKQLVEENKLVKTDPSPRSSKEDEDIE